MVNMGVLFKDCIRISGLFFSFLMMLCLASILFFNMQLESCNACSETLNSKWF